MTIIEQLVGYFTKNYGRNTVTGATGGSLLTLVLIGLQSGSYDQMIGLVQNAGPYGLIAGAIFAGLRTAAQVYKASKG